jgi:type VI secretion system protein ImpC
MKMNTTTSLTTNTEKSPLSWGQWLVSPTQDEQMRLQRALVMVSDAAGDADINEHLNLCNLIDSQLLEIDAQLSAQMDEIIHHPEFKSLEASWRGLAFLLNHIENPDQVKVRLLNINMESALSDLRCAADFDQSQLFRLIYEEEYGSFGGTPFSTLIIDQAIGLHPDHLYFIEQVTKIGAAAHTPVIASPAPTFFGMRSFSELTVPMQLSTVFETPAYIKWRSFRQTEDARYLGMVLPQVLGRLPYDRDQQRTATFDYAESLEAEDGQDFLWMNAAYAYGANLIKAFSQFGWLAAIRGVEGGGLVEDLPIFSSRSREGEMYLQCPTQIAITDRLEKQLSDQGFIGLVYCKNTDYAAFFSGQSIQKARHYHSDLANANSRLSGQLPYVFAISRIAHYLKAIVRDKIGSFSSAESVQRFLNQWLAEYVLLDDHASQEAKARFPLREAQVEVIPAPGLPGQFKAAVFLRPHFQLDELTVSLRLVTELPQTSR